MTLLETKKSCPGNIKAYLTSLGKFCEFIVNQTKHNVSGFSTIEQSQLQAITNVISRFRAMLSSISLRSGRSSMRTGKLPWVLSWLRKSWTQEPAKDSIKQLCVNSYNGFSQNKDTSSKDGRRVMKSWPILYAWMTRLLNWWKIIHVDPNCKPIPTLKAP